MSRRKGKRGDYVAHVCSCCGNETKRGNITCRNKDCRRRERAAINARVGARVVVQ